MASSTTRRIAAVLAVPLSAVVWAVMALFGAPADAHHGAPVGKGGTATAKPVPQAAAAPAPSATPPAQAQSGSISGVLDVGAKSDQVKAVEQRLDALKYFVGSIDGDYDETLFQAVMAYQKVNGFDRTGKVDQQLWSTMQSASEPQPLVAGGAAHRVEVDLRRQVLFLYKDGKLNKISAVASGTSDTPTPTGDFKIYRYDPGWHTSRLGRLYNAKYFVGGYALHGSLSVPAQPASHGCVRLPMEVAEWFPDQVPNGTPVHVRAG